MKKQIFLVCLWMVWSAAILSAQEPPQAPSENLSLQDAIALAAQKHPGLLELEAQSQAAWARAKAASAWDNPELLLKTEGNSFNSGTGDYMVGLGQSIPIGGRISKARDAAEKEADLSARAKNLRLLEILG
jgi:outer membrane protein TolC